MSVLNFGHETHESGFNLRAGLNNLLYLLKALTKPKVSSSSLYFTINPLTTVISVKKRDLKSLSVFTIRVTKLPEQITTFPSIAIWSIVAETGSVFFQSSSKTSFTCLRFVLIPSQGAIVSLPGIYWEQPHYHFDVAFA
jgi:hypothetical protein